MATSKTQRGTRASRCRSWVQQQNEIPGELREKPAGGARGDSLGRRRAADASEGDSDTSRAPPKKRVFRELISAQLILHECEWLGCQESYEDYGQYQRHVRSHMPELLVKPIDGGASVYVCLWDICGFETGDRGEVMRHVNFHAYHTRIKAIGRNVRERLSLQRCCCDSTKRNRLPAQPEDSLCRWADCELTFNSAQDFFDHVRCHVLGAATNAGGQLVCSWLGCRQSSCTSTQLGAHVRRHTGERLVACYHCGGAFSTNGKLRDHCERQVPSVEQEYQCPTCSRLFPTSRLLRDHARRHVMAYECSSCGLTSPTPSALAQHIRYRHLHYRPFKCPHCPYAAVSNHDLRTHQMRHEGPVPRTYPRRVYACHCCSALLGAGASLSRHLLRVHGYSLPKGFSRLRYEESADGMYRLMDVRYETAALSNREPLAAPASPGDGGDFTVLQSSPGSLLYPASFCVVPAAEDKRALHAPLEEPQQDTSDCKSTTNIKPRRLTRRNRRRAAVPRHSESLDPEDEPYTQDVQDDKDDKDDRDYPVHSAGKAVKEEEWSVAPRRKTIDEFSCMRRFGRRPPSPVQSIEISIEEVDLLGNVIKTEVVESQPLIV